MLPRFDILGNCPQSPKIMPSLKLCFLMKLCHVYDVTQCLTVLFVYCCGFQLEAFVIVTDTDYRRKCRVHLL